MRHIFSDTIEQEALEQFNDCCQHSDFIQGALMPDAHKGYSMPIGGVIKLKETIVPAWVGYDIGCGMCAVKTGSKLEHIIGKEQDILEAILEFVPVGQGGYNKTNFTASNIRELLPFKGTKIATLFREAIEKQCGTLGSGNHFIEIAADEEENIWIVIHSGSRGLGWKTAEVYMTFDEENNGFNINSKIGMQYIKDMDFCLEFALLNRKTMLKRIEKAFCKALEYGCKFKMDTLINRHHNHAEIVTDGVIHRKGATHANNGMLGVIPGNMKDGSFITQGLGNPDSLNSSSHGAGRVLSRKKAKELLNYSDFKEEMAGITCITEGTIEEAPKAYKDIFEVIRLQEEQNLIKVIHHLKPVINVKGK